MTNVHYLRGQLTMALGCLKRGLDSLDIFRKPKCHVHGEATPNEKSNVRNAN